jgi:hypothetical protein
MKNTTTTAYESGLDPGLAREVVLMADVFTTAGGCLSHHGGTYPRVAAGLFGLFLLATGAHAADRLDLEGTTITGSQELPKALNIVPWKPAEAGDLAARPMNSLVDEILAPIDRDVFLRELEYYDAVHSSK